ncbi:hypothetical protein [Vreelandella alkaliphila]|uniref:Uncharacterized protein n=1 Tax=Vreelandella alkaliphila TaxID=272774 RepID=A0AAJ2VSN9_9GAMM|nr:hypothetical protein [Halomonas alkaliphila]MDX5979620.1 hypothetical protein [Halomonas alkaliphila]
MRRQSQSSQLRAYLERHGMEPLNDDLRFLVAVLRMIPTDAHDWLTSHYAGRWLTTMERTDTDHLRQNLGRRAANQWVIGILKRRKIAIPDSRILKEIRV